MHYYCELFPIFVETKQNHNEDNSNQRKGLCNSQ